MKTSTVRISNLNCIYRGMAKDRKGILIEHPEMHITGTCRFRPLFFADGKRADVLPKDRPVALVDLMTPKNLSAEQERIMTELDNSGYDLAEAYALILGATYELTYDNPRTPHLFVDDCECEWDKDAPLKDTPAYPNAAKEHYFSLASITLTHVEEKPAPGYGNLVRRILCGQAIAEIVPHWRPSFGRMIKILDTATGELAIFTDLHPLHSPFRVEYSKVAVTYRQPTSLEHALFAESVRLMNDKSGNTSTVTQHEPEKPSPAAPCNVCGWVHDGGDMTSYRDPADERRRYTYKATSDGYRLLALIHGSMEKGCRDVDCTTFTGKNGKPFFSDLRDTLKLRRQPDGHRVLLALVGNRRARIRKPEETRKIGRPANARKRI